MKPHPRIRKTVKWGGAVVTVLLAVVWIGSAWWAISWYRQRGISFIVVNGCLDVEDRLGRPWPTELLGWEVRPHDPHFRWSLDWASRSSVWLISVPLWMPLALSVIVTAAAWRLDTLARRRARMNLCPKCNYDRTGLAAGVVCPECGTKA